ncbi:SRPBCC family protein [Sphingosinicella soli]|uniref:SRPBCC family protein n=1 Tax=Sphingosinicella soli TaxID=333708 RepID=A0A7W7F7U4_9SPHN|nr:SRPBCC family protein [Sphingosinicella soli]MBB4633034.1 hypothetical protein [Sphingosinicella soli]
MITVERAVRVDAAASRVWTLFATQEGQRRAEEGFVSSIEFEGEGLGMVRTMRTEGHLADGYVKERLDHYDAAEMEMMFRIIDTGDIVPFADYCGFAKIIPAGPSACVLLMRSTFVPVDMPEAEARAISEENYRLFIANVHAAVAAGDV